MYRFTFIILISLSFFIENTNSQENWYWQNPKPQGNRLNDIYCIDESNIILVGSLGTILRSNNGGITWDIQHKTNSILNNLYSVYFVDDSIGWISGYAGTIIKTKDSGLTWEIQNSGTTSLLLSVYFINSNVGREVETLSEGVFSTGKYQVSWIVNNVPSGLYFYKLETDGYYEIRKMILQK